MWYANDGQFIKTDVEIALSICRVRLVRYESDNAIDITSAPQPFFRLDFSITPRLGEARACFRDRWNPHRFERLGDIFLFPPGEVIQSRSRGGNQIAIAIDYEPKAVGCWFQPEARDLLIRANLDITDPHVRGSMLRLKSELISPGFGSNALCDSLAMQAAIDIARRNRILLGFDSSTTLAPWRLKLIDERLEDLGAPPSLGELARICKLSVRHLTRGFRASRGCSIGSYIEQLRCDHAKRLLASGVSVEEVALATGFRSSSNFSIAFRRATGETPRAYRERIVNPPSKSIPSQNN